MFGNPIAMEAELFSMNGEGRGVDESFANGASFNDGDEVQNGKNGSLPGYGAMIRFISIPRIRTY